MKKYFLFLLLFTFILSCGRKTNTPVSGEKLTKEKMIEVLLDIHLAEASANQMALNTNAGRDSMLIEYEKIFSKHEVDGTDFFATYNYYTENPELLDTIYNELVIRATTIQSNIFRKTPVDSTAMADSAKARMFRMLKARKGVIHN